MKYFGVSFYLRVRDPVYYYEQSGRKLRKEKKKNANLVLPRELEGNRCPRAFFVVVNWPN